MERRSTLRAALPGALLLTLVCAYTANLGRCQDSASPARANRAALPAWAYPALPPAQAAAAEQARSAALLDRAPLHVPGSSRTYSMAYIMDRFTVPDWFPGDHPPMPGPVRQGKKPDAYACGYCHLPNGLGRPENESLAGLPKAYLLEQIQDFKDGSRHSSEPRMDSVTHMIQAARAITPQEAEAAAEYFSRLKLTPWIRVVETATVPRTHLSGGMLVADAQGTEPIGPRIIEVAENNRQTLLRNPRSGFIAYVPPGSVAKGKTLVSTGENGKTIPCAICHGQQLHGMGNVPGIAGRSPSQMARQLIDIRDGARRGAGTALMKMPVAKLSNADILAITAYLASLKP